MNGGRSRGEIGLAHDYLLVLRGAERTFLEIAALWPEAPIYTTLYSSAGTEHRLDGRRVVTSPLARLRLSQRSFRRVLPAYPWAVGRLPVAGHRVVVSSSSAFAHGVRVGEGAVHICYCHTPFRYSWHERERALAEVARPLRPLLDLTLERMRRWDLGAAERVTAYVANSKLTQRRIAEAYGREAEVIHPPVDVDRFQLAEPEDYFLLVSELVPHKRIEVALRAAERAGVRLVVVGGGPEAGRLSRRYRSAEFVGRVGDSELTRLYERCLAGVVPNVEEFGIVAVECQAAGRPVLAPRGGGAEETVVDGTTGILVESDDVEELADALTGFDFTRFNPELARRNAASFRPARFRRQLSELVARVAERPVP